MADLRMERVLWRRGYRAVAGLDEVGRGCLAGPVVAAAVILPPFCGALEGVDDSKKLSPAAREAAYAAILRQALWWGVGAVDNRRIDQVNIRNASFEAMHQALSGLAPDCLLVDGNARLPGTSLPQRAVVRGDARVMSIAAASIVAKVTRDRMALQWDEQYPVYGFARHKGYSAPEHFRALERHGPCPLHRATFIQGRQARLQL